MGKKNSSKSRASPKKNDVVRSPRTIRTADRISEDDIYPESNITEDTMPTTISGEHGDKSETLDPDSDNESEEIQSMSVASAASSMPFDAKVFMWEFGQNDPKRDSGSKLCRLGYAKVLRVGSTFSGIVLSSEATTFISPADAEIVAAHGVSGINCSWNRIDEIPFASMGKNRMHRILPLIYAANTVNYGKPYKMNTAEAIAASLYIVGMKEQAKSLRLANSLLMLDAFKLFLLFLLQLQCITMSNIIRLHTLNVFAVGTLRITFQQLEV